MSTSDNTELSSASLRCVITGSNVDHTDVETSAEIVSLTLFDLGAQAVGSEMSQGHHTLIAGFATMLDAEAASDAVRARHSTLVSTTAVDEVLASTWVDAQRNGIEPSTIGPWHIRAPWHPEPTESEGERAHDIVIDPGVAFGHGAHPSTALAIELMLRHVRPDNADSLTVADLGTGTGVVAIIAARLGATVDAIENDAGPLEVAWQNVERNSVHPFESTGDRITLTNGDAAHADVDGTDVVVANVTLDVQRLLAPTCAHAHVLIVSGVLCRQVHQMQDLYPALRASTICTRGDWAAIEFLSENHLRRKNH